MERRKIGRRKIIWQKMDSAPEDGSELLILCKYGKNFFILPYMYDSDQDRFVESRPINLPAPENATIRLERWIATPPIPRELL